MENKFALINHYYYYLIYYYFFNSFNLINVSYNQIFNDGISMVCFSYFGTQMLWSFSGLDKTVVRQSEWCRQLTSYY